MQVEHRIIGMTKNGKGDDFPIYQSTSDMSKKAFSADIEKINRFYIESEQIGIPDHRASEYYSNIANEIGYSG